MAALEAAIFFAEMNDDGDIEEEDLRPPAAVSAELYSKWQSPRYGTANPELMNNPVWEWLIRSGITAYHARRAVEGYVERVGTPGWCFDRFGQSCTRLPDGREVLIAGEHEDHYDPDFHIYNDVVVRHPDGALDVYGYPESVFPATDFHSATLVEDKIIIIGCLGYEERRKAPETPIKILELSTFSIRNQQVVGSSPGWIHCHSATLADDGGSIVIKGGKLDGENPDTLVENIDDWRLDLLEWKWERLTKRNWRRWELSRADGQLNHLWDYQQLEWDKLIPDLAGEQGPLAEFREEFEIPTLEEELGAKPDMELFGRLYKPPIEFEPVPSSDEDEFGVVRIKVSGVIVRYVEDMHSIQMTVEGELTEGQLETLTNDVKDRFSRLEKTEIVLREL